jgi:enterochelin esterase-like enzyme
MKSLLIGQVFAAFLLLAREPAPGPVVSPEVLPDRRVTFRVRAPHASEVGLWGDWLPSNTPLAMTRDSRGDWSLTLGPLESGPSIYTVTVDGVTTPDPINPRVKLRARTSASLVTVPGDTSEWWDVRDVPHGSLEVVWARSEIIGDTRSYIVYIPPGYYTSRSKRYPLLCLLHGSNDTAAGWTDVGRANFILDNLVAAHRAAPMIVVMPWGHALPFDGPQQGNDAVFERYLLEEIIPQVQKRYRVKSGPKNLAVVGLSMGGGQALKVGLGHLNRFGAVAAFSAAVPSDFAERFQSVLDAPEQTNQRLALLWIGCGRQDGMFERSRWLAEFLDHHGIRHTFVPTEGRHNFALWRRYLAEVLPQLFDGPAAAKRN